MRTRAVPFSLLLLVAAACASVPNAGIHADLQLFETEFLQKDRALSDTAREEGARDIRTLLSHGGRLSEQQIRLRLAEIVARADNGGSVVLDGPWGASQPRLPIRSAWFADGLLVLRATAPHADLAGARVVAIDGRPTEAIYSAVSRYFGGPEGRRRSRAPMMIERPDLMHAAGLSRRADALHMELMLPNGARVERWIEAIAPAPISFWPDRLSPEGMPGDPGVWTHAINAERLPLYLRDFENPRRVEVLPDYAFIQVKWTPAVATLDEAPFFAAARDAARNRTNLVIDLRFDHGGSTEATIAFLQDLAAANSARGGRSWLILGPMTHSTGIVTAAAIIRVAGDSVSIVGEAPGERLQFWGSGGRVCLESLRVCVLRGEERFDLFEGCEVSDCDEAYRGYRVRSLSPTVVAPLSITDYVAQRDPSLDAIRAALVN